MPRNRYDGLFKQAKNRSRRQLTDSQDFLRAVAAASNRHPVSRTYDGANLTRTEQSRSTAHLAPIESRREFAEEVENLAHVFEREEGREPTPDDDAFWEAFNRIFDVYIGPEIRDLGRLFAEAGVSA